jgi:DNA-binding transcriptional LysR family regulator
VVVGSTPWVETQRALSHPADLRAAPCVGLRFPSGVLYQWQFRRNDEALAIAVTGPLTVDDQRVAIQAALDGVGWAYVYESMVIPYLRSGSLVQALADWCPSEPGFQLYYPSRHQVSPALRALIDWVRQQPPVGDRPGALSADLRSMPEAAAGGCVA